MATYLHFGVGLSIEQSSYTQNGEKTMQATFNNLLTQGELARRWGRTESAISLATAVGAGPRYIKIDGAIRYPVDEVQRYERACLYFDPAEVALQTVN
jgi:hypothetical protein